MLFSVVIPVWKRPKELDLLLKSLDIQACKKKIIIEVILSDSCSGEDVDNVVDNSKVFFENLSIKHIQTENIVAKKRNMGTKCASGEYLIYLDDDCLPADNFLDDCIANISIINHQNIVVCGEVRFLDEMVLKSNYYKYRDSRHPNHVTNINVLLNAWSFVSMNYMISRKALMLVGLEYGEDFFGYGAEDHDYGFRLCQQGFVILQGKQKIWHLEYGGSIDRYAVKIYHSARDGMLNLKNINLELYNSAPNNIKFLEKNVSENRMLLSFIYLLFFNNFIYLAVVRFLKFTDGNGKLYINSLFRYVILRSYIKGIFDRKEVDKKVLVKNWYE